jgi:N4-gp56 family major capsid protein
MSVNLQNNQFVGFNNGIGLGQAGTHTIKPDAYYDRMLLKMLRNMQFPFAKYAIQKTLPRNFGDTINWRRFNRLAYKDPSDVLLEEGVTPDGQTISGSERIAIIQQYGAVMYFTDVIDMIQLDRVRQEYTVELGYQAKEVLDRIVRDVLVAEGSAYFAGGTVTTTAALAALNSGTGIAPTIDDFRKITLGMKREHVYGVRGTQGKYVAMVAPEVMFKLFDDERVEKFMDWGQTNTMFKDGMIVDMFGIRFEEVIDAPKVPEIVNSNEVYVYDSIVLGEEAYAVTKLEGAGIRVITKGLGSSGTNDPLDQRQSIGWKISGFGAAVLNPLAVVNYWSVPDSEFIFDGSEHFKTETFDRNGRWPQTQPPTGADEGALFNAPTQLAVTFANVTAGEVLEAPITVNLILGQTLGQAIAGTPGFPAGTTFHKIVAGTDTAVPLTDVFGTDIAVTAAAAGTPNTVTIFVKAAA